MDKNEILENLKKAKEELTETNGDLEYGRFVYLGSRKEYGMVLCRFPTVLPSFKGDTSRRYIVLVISTETDNNEPGFRIRYPKENDISRIDSDTTSGFLRKELRKHCNEQCMLECSEECYLWKFKNKNI